MIVINLVGSIRAGVAILHVDNDQSGVFSIRVDRDQNLLGALLELGSQYHTSISLCVNLDNATR